jgi:hypothetical protein
MEWRVPTRTTVLKFAAAVAFLVLGVVVARDLVAIVVAGLAALALAVFGMRDLFAPVRLAAHPDGVTVVEGFSSRRHIPWSQIERIRVDSRRRLLSKSTLLEIDAGESLHFFSAGELGAPPAEVVDALLALRTGR